MSSRPPAVSGGLTPRMQREVMEIVRQMLASQTSGFAQCVIGDRTLAVSADGKTLVETLGQNVPTPATFPAATAAAFDGSIQASIAAGAVDLEVFVDGAAGAFPVSVEVRAVSRTGTLLASHSFSAAGSIDKTDDADLGARDASEPGWWLKMTAANGTELWAEQKNPFVLLDTAVDGELAGTHIAADSIATAHLQAGSVTAAKMSVAQLAAIAADLGTVLAGTIVVGPNGIEITFVDANDDPVGFINAFGSVASGSYGIEIGAGGSSLELGVQSNPVIPDNSFNGDLQVSGGLSVGGAFNIGGGPVTAGDTDSGGSGFRMLRVPN